MPKTKRNNRPVRLRLHPPAPAGRLDPEVLWSAMFAMLLALAGSIHFFFPRLRLTPFCPFKVLTGLPCPTCGGTRALLALADGHPLTAWSMNPLATAGMLLGAVGGLYAWGAVLTGRRVRLESWSFSPAHARLTLAALALATAANWAYLIAMGR